MNAPGAPRTQFVVVSAGRAMRCARRHLSTGLSSERTPLAGLILNRTHPTLCDSHAEKAEEAADELWPTIPSRFFTAGAGASTPTAPRDRQARGMPAVAVHRGEPARGDRRGAVSVAVRRLRPEALRAIADQTSPAKLFFLECLGAALHR